MILIIFLRNRIFSFFEENHFSTPFISFNFYFLKSKLKESQLATIKWCGLVYWSFFFFFFCKFISRIHCLGMTIDIIMMLKGTHMDARLAFLFLNNFPVGKVPSPFSVTKMHVNHKKKKEDFDLINGL